MTDQPKETTNKDTQTSSNQSDGDHTVDDWNSIGDLARTILSGVKARKKATEDVAPSVADFAQSREDVASNQIVRRVVRAGNRRKGCSLAGHDNENFRTEQQVK
ncbi:hypothetical protein [Phyllobacterium endophyticum]|nr:hypothetical protein [Phyllobacterium endophyticum]MBB3234404.1 hypothetical protein [Phyllobacterium endophyticum]TYR44130.1 hypothetical protein FY050_02895 [Phyllobacterium endophyticum]